MKHAIPFALLALVCTLGCEAKKEETVPAAASVAPLPPPALTPVATAKPVGPDLKVAQDAAELANKIEQTPADAEKILTAAGTSREAFIEKLYVIAEDSALSAEYARLYPAKQPG